MTISVHILLFIHIFHLFINSLLLFTVVIKVEDIFDQVAKNGGFIVADDVVKKYNKQAISLYGKKAPYPIGIQSLLKGENEVLSNLRVQVYISLLIHELIHRAGISGHERFGREAFNALSAEDQKLNPLPKKKSEYESYFTNRFNENCSYNPYVTK